jgi:sucrose phosphorylase
MSHLDWPDNVRDCLTFLYGVDRAGAVFDHLEQWIARHREHLPDTSQRVSERDAILITYPDQFRYRDTPPLQGLADFARRYLEELLSAIHILPFYPSTSDDGFSVVDYREVNSEWGEWDDVQRIGQRFKLMFDAVINHVSAHSEWFKGFLRDDPRYRDWFIVVDPNVDLSAVVRPRALPLLTRVESASGPKHVWTTFSADQIDLNFANPGLLLEIIEVLLFYVMQGAQFIRLDAIAYLWKEIGASCIHLPQTHRVVQLWRAILDHVAPGVMLITETNVPHEDNVAYFGDGTNEAHMVYNFALPPLTLHAFHAGDAQTLSRWAAALTRPSDQTTFFNFLASHDGIGLNPARGILPENEIEQLCERTLAHGGLISYKNNPDGTRSPYEMNINYFDALSDPAGGESIETQVDRFIAAQAIMLALAGLPGIYVHSLLGSRSDHAGVERTGHNRAINRQKFDADALEEELGDLNSLRARVLQRYAMLLRARAAQPAFDPYGPQRILEGHAAIFAVLRSTRAGDQRVLCLHNVSNQPQTFKVDSDVLRVQAISDLIEGGRYALESEHWSVKLKAYQVKWLGIE